MELGRIFLVLGAVLIAIGAALLLVPRDTNVFSWFGHLPGDIYYRSENTVVWIPWVSMLLVSVVVSVVLWLVRAVTGRV